MNVSIIASYDKYSLAEEMFGNIKNIRRIRIMTGNEKTPKGIIKSRFESSDLILVVIDKSFESNKFLNEEFNIALFVARQDSRKIVIPILIDGCKIPTGFEGGFYLSCDTSSPKDIARVKRYIDYMVNYRLQKKSDTTQKTKSSTMIVLTVAIELFAGLFVVLFYMDTPLSISGSSYDELTVGLLGTLSIFLALTTLFISYISILKRRRTEENNEELELYSKRLKEAISSDSVNPKDSAVDEKVEIDALGRMMINLEDIKEFYTWSQKQAKSAFNLARFMCVVGFLLIAFAVISPIILDLSIKASILPALGGLVTELIAGTALIVYKSSLSQLNHYHKALHEDERFLSSVNLISKFNSPDIQDEMLKEIICSEIQMNLVSLNLPQSKSNE